MDSICILGFNAWYFGELILCYFFVLQHTDRISSISSTDALTCIKRYQIICILFISAKRTDKTEREQNTQNRDRKEHEIFSRAEKFKWKRDSMFYFREDRNSTLTTLREKKVFSTYLTGIFKRCQEFLTQLALGFKRHHEIYFFSPI